MMFGNLPLANSCFLLNGWGWDGLVSLVLFFLFFPKRQVADPMSGRFGGCNECILAVDFG